MLILVLLLLCTCISSTLYCVHLSSTLPARLNLLPLSVSADIARLMASMRSSSATWGFFLRNFVHSSSLLVNNTIRNPQNPLNKTAFLPFTSLTTTFHYLLNQPPVTNALSHHNPSHSSRKKSSSAIRYVLEHAIAAVHIKSSHEVVKQASIQANAHSSVEKSSRTGPQKCYTEYPHGFRFSTCIRH